MHIDVSVFVFSSFMHHRHHLCSNLDISRINGVNAFEMRLSATTGALSLLGADLVAGAHTLGQDFESACLSFKPQSCIYNSTLTRLEYVKNGTTLQLTDNDSTCGRPSQQVFADLCRIGLEIPTSNRSSISFELWLPEDWSSGRYLATGNGGIDGCE